MSQINITPPVSPRLPANNSSKLQSKSSESPKQEQPVQPAASPEFDAYARQGVKIAEFTPQNPLDAVESLSKEDDPILGTTNPVAQELLLNEKDDEARQPLSMAAVKPAPAELKEESAPPSLRTMVSRIPGPPSSRLTNSAPSSSRSMTSRIPGPPSSRLTTSASSSPRNEASRIPGPPSPRPNSPTPSDRLTQSAPPSPRPNSPVLSERSTQSEPFPKSEKTNAPVSSRRRPNIVLPPGIVAGKSYKILD
jgi:hypothetical protein